MGSPCVTRGWRPRTLATQPGTAIPCWYSRYLVFSVIGSLKNPQIPIWSLLPVFWPIFPPRRSEFLSQFRFLRNLRSGIWLGISIRHSVSYLLFRKIRFASGKCVFDGGDILIRLRNIQLIRTRPIFLQKILVTRRVFRNRFVFLSVYFLPPVFEIAPLSFWE